MIGHMIRNLKVKKSNYICLIYFSFILSDLFCQNENLNIVNKTLLDTTNISSMYSTADTIFYTDKLFEIDNIKLKGNHVNISKELKVISKLNSQIPLNDSLKREILFLMNDYSRLLEKKYGLNEVNFYQHYFYYGSILLELELILLWDYFVKSGLSKTMIVDNVVDAHNLIRFYWNNRAKLDSSELDELRNRILVKLPITKVFEKFVFEKPNFPFYLISFLNDHFDEINSQLLDRIECESTKNCSGDLLLISNKNFAIDFIILFNRLDTIKNKFQIVKILNSINKSKNYNVIEVIGNLNDQYSKKYFEDSLIGNCNNSKLDEISILSYLNSKNGRESASHLIISKLGKKSHCDRSLELMLSFCCNKYSDSYFKLKLRNAKNPLIKKYYLNLLKHSKEIYNLSLELHKIRPYYYYKPFLNYYFDNNL